MTLSASNSGMRGLWRVLELTSVVIAWAAAFCHVSVTCIGVVDGISDRKDSSHGCTVHLSITTLPHHSPYPHHQAHISGPITPNTAPTNPISITHQTHTVPTPGALFITA